MTGTKPTDGSPLSSDNDLQTTTQPSQEEILAQLERVLSSSEFTSSARLQKLLRFIVTETLAGRSDRLKEYTIAIDVYERDESFDPQTNSIVRVEAGRLRGKLERYNAIEGRDEPIQIKLISGSYVPSFAFAKSLDASNQPDDSSGFTDAPWKKNFGRNAALGASLVVAASIIVFLSIGSNFWLPSEPGVETLASDQTYSVAVLPLRNLSGDPEDEYFSDGMTDALITGLAQERVANVTSLTSVMAYKNIDRAVTEIANELGVSHIVEGSILRVGDNIRITAQLIEAENDLHLWAESYERQMSNILALQDEVVERIVSSMAQYVTPQGAVTSVGITDIDPLAYEAHLRGRFFLNQMTEDGFEQGITYFEESIEIEPEYAASHSGLAACYCLLGGHGFELVNPHEGMPAAKRAVMEALRLDSNWAEAHSFLGIIQLKYDWDWPSAEESFTRAIELNPSYSRGHIFYSYYLEAMGEEEAAVREAAAARALDPLSPAANLNLGWQYLQAGRPADAGQVLEQTAEIYPDHWAVHWSIGQYHLHLGENDEAIAAFQRANAAGGGHAMPLSALGYTYALSGRENDAREALSNLEAMSAEGYVSPYHMAVIHAGLNENDEALELLEEAYTVRSRSMAWLNVAPEMETLRSDPRFATLLQRVGLTE